MKVGCKGVSITQTCYHDVNVLDELALNHHENNFIINYTK